MKLDDLAVAFKAVMPGDVSLVARQVGKTFAAYLPKPGGLAIHQGNWYCTTDEGYLYPDPSASPAPAPPRSGLSGP